MKKFLTILWIIIIGGSTLIAIKIFKPSTQQETINEDFSQQFNETPETNQAFNSKNFNEYLESAENELSNNNPKKAIEYLQQAYKANPSSSNTLIKLGNTYIKINDGKDSKQAFSIAEKLNPKSLEAKIGEARADIVNKNIESAKNLIWSLDQNDATVKYYQAIILILGGDYENAKIKFQELSKLEDQNSAEVKKKSEIYLEKFETYSLFTESEPAFLRVLLAQAFTDTQEYHSAILLLFDIINKKNNYRDAWILLGYNYLMTNQQKEAIDSFKQAEALNPENPKILFFLGIAYASNNEIPKAINYLKAAEKYGYEPKNDLQAKLGDLYIIEKQYQNAETSFNTIIENNPNDNLQIFTKLVWLEIDKLNNPTKALEIANIALNNFPENSTGYNLAGWAYTALEDFTNAKNYLDKAIAMDPELDLINLNVGWLYEKEGSSTMAKEYYKRAYILGKGNSIGNLAAIRFNKITEAEFAKYYQTNISSPQSP